MSNEQLMQNELEKAISPVDNVTIDELSNEELNNISGGFKRQSCVRTSAIPGLVRRVCARRSRRFQGSDLD
ncbi:MAG: bacteriocin [Scytonematopsis contorta HA4267-MV1]|jgi:bacteriocin-like protein|nr:bacteriocin [Scytonematopsis contorta HA4267-MV1]